MYIDTDAIVERDLLTLEEYSNELNSVVGFGGLDNMDETFKYALKIPFHLNTGLLYLNLDRCRLINFTLRVLERCGLNLHPDAGHDQIAINQLYSGSEIYARLDQTWYIQTPIPEALTLVPRGGGILHICGPFKPWTFTCPLIWRDILASHLPHNFQLPRVMPTNTVQCIYAGNIAVQEGDQLSANLFLCWQAQE